MATAAEEAAKAAELQTQQLSQGYDMYGRPIRPAYSPTFDPATQSVLPFVQSRTAGISMDPRGMERFRGEALRRGPSQYAMLARKELGQTQKEMQDRAAREAASTQAGAQSAMAMRGGATGGARERIAKGGAENLMAMRQGIAGEGIRGRLGIAKEDERSRMEALGRLPGMEIAALQPEFQRAGLDITARGQDIGRTVAEKQAKNLFDMTGYQEAMRAWAAGRQATATENAGKK